MANHTRRDTKTSKTDTIHTTQGHQLVATLIAAEMDPERPDWVRRVLRDERMHLQAALQQSPVPDPQKYKTRGEHMPIVETRRWVTDPKTGEEYRVYDSVPANLHRLAVESALAVCRMYEVG